MAVNQFRVITLEGLEVFREDARFDTPPKWTAQNCTIVKIEPAEDGTSCKVIGLKKGKTTLTITDENNATTPPLVFEIEIVPSPVATFGATIEPPTSIEEEEKPDSLNPFLGPRIDGNEAVPVVNPGVTLITPDVVRSAKHVE